MANALFQKYVEACMTTGGPNLLTATIRCFLIDTGAYTVDLAAHQYLSSVPGGARIGSAVLSNKSVTARVFNADPISITGLSSPPTGEALLLVADTGTDATSQLIAWIDTATGLPTAAGITQANVSWDTGADKIFKL